MQRNVVFMGSPEYAVPVLKMLASQYQVVGVITQPDQPVGRGRKMKSPAIKNAADNLSLKVLQPNRIKGDDFFQQLSAMTPDVIVVAAYGKILPKRILELPQYGCVNVHASLLPRWRGASPIQNAILHGDKKSGVTIMLMDEGVDTGPILTKQEVDILDMDTAESLSVKLAKSGAELLEKTLPDYFEGKIMAQVQEEEVATYTQMIKKYDALLDFNNDAAYLVRQVRAYYPWPISFFRWEDNLLRVVEASDNQTQNLDIGQRGIIDKYPCIGTSTTDLKLIQVQPAGKRIMSGKDFLNGARNWLKLAGI